MARANPGRGARSKTDLRPRRNTASDAADDSPLSAQWIEGNSRYAQIFGAEPSDESQGASFRMTKASSVASTTAFFNSSSRSPLSHVVSGSKSVS